ncbi:aconitase family protein, partial [uncultured Senegalimassilia sp.]|uniref:aconitase family protein n=1 Tax=uncultured Senegalimassilia sp. TaxID=1714350 RepID=UPI0025D4B62C
MKNEKFAATLSVGDAAYTYYPVEQVEGSEKLPYALKVLLENVLRNAEGPEAAAGLAKRVVEAGCAGEVGSEVEFSPARVLFQDFTGVPVFVDFAVMREACANLGGDPAKINPQIPCDLVIDHSVIADVAGCSCAMEKNMEMEFQRNGERYNFLKWAQKSFQNVRIVPPGAGICHQLNIEEFAQVAMTSTAAGVETPEGENPTVYFDTLVGTDSHTPTANGIGVLGWGVGGIEAEAAALGQPITTLVPKVVGVRLTGKLSEGVAAMDVALTFAKMLREKGVVGCFVECFGPGLDSLNATQRTCISNMTPEYGSTCTLFPVDD